MKNLTVSFILIFISLLTAGNHPWPMWGHDVRHTNRTEMKGLIPGGHCVVIENIAYTTNYSALVNINNKIFIIDSGLHLLGEEGVDDKSESYFYLVLFDTEKMTFAILDSIGESIGFNSLGTPMIIGEDSLYYSYVKYDSSTYTIDYNLNTGQISPNGSYSSYFNIKTDFNGASVYTDDRLYVTHNTDDWENEADLICYDKAGTLIWKNILETECYATAPAIDSMENVFVMSEKNLFAFDKDGIKLWQFAMNTEFSTVGGYYGNRILLSHAPLVSKDNKIIVPSDNGLYAFSAQEGRILWQVSGKKGVAAPAEAVDGTIYFPYNNGIMAVNPDGSEKWSYTEFAPSPFPLTVDGEGKIYFTTEEPYGLVCLSSDGEKLGRAKYHYHYEGSEEYSYSCEDRYPFGQVQVFPNGILSSSLFDLHSGSFQSGEHYFTYYWNTKGGLCFFDEKKGFSSSKTSRSLPERLTFTCSPNPFSSRLGISVNSPSSEVLQIYDISGRLVFRKNLEKGESRHFFSPSANGVYIIKIGNKTRKVVKIS